MAELTRRAALAAFGALGAGSILGLGLLRRGLQSMAVRLTDGGGFMGAGHMDMSRYMEMFMRHSEIDRVVEDIPGGVRTTTESASPDLPEKGRQTLAHAADFGALIEVGVHARNMRLQLGRQVRRRRFGGGAHAREVTGFVAEGMPAMMQQMMGQGRMGCGGMMGPRRP
ncbi:hypothetical protein [Mycobacterium sp. E2497]|uniref:hypothetical protein n=2 Tax=unclassified Mycobacterium TaxID=2642494 RepID=UPI0008008E2A|nr:hypothetical protein [Mycobacterium sp. E2497]OBI11514.1 hypothetical protein A5713_00385 [Mycobacterium sp. E2497]